MGVITSVNLNHATPAAFYAHQASRNDYYDIGLELIDSGFEYFAGGGLLKPTGAEGDQADLYALAEKAGYHVVKTQAEAEQVTGGPVVIIDEHLADSDAMAYEIDRTDDMWALADYVEKGIEVLSQDKDGFFISNVSAMHIRAMDFEPFAFRINDNALPELIEGYRPEAKKPGRPEEEKFDPYRHISEQQHRIALEAAFGLKEEYGYKDLETSLIKSYMSVGVKLNHQKAVSLITMLRNKRMIVQENGRKYTFKPDFHY